MRGQIDPIKGKADRSPPIEHISWARTQVEGLGTFKDVKLWPGGGRTWDWNETGTTHRPGIQPSDVDELLEHGSEVVVLGRGMLGSLGVCQETLELLEIGGIEAHVERTEEAVEVYNSLARDRPIGGLFHSTC